MKWFRMKSIMMQEFPMNIFKNNYETDRPLNSIYITVSLWLIFLNSLTILFYNATALCFTLSFLKGN